MPLSVASTDPSDPRDPNDGPWSTFALQVGTPPQTVRLLPATEQSSVWIVLPEGCTPTDVPDCPDVRGFEFRINQSSTWSEEGLFELSLDEEVKLGYSGNAQYGYDTVTVGWQGEGLPTVPRQVIAGFATKDFYVGRIPLNPSPFNFSDFNDPKPSLLQSVRDAGQIPSLSWAYTAGSYRHVPKVFGSLTLGGYDSARFVANDVTFSLSPKRLQDLVVAVQSITTDATPTPLLSDGIYMPINSLVSHIWLPVDVCSAFERAFGLVWDNVTDLYLVSDEQHDNLTSRNPNVTFRLGPSLTGPSVDIVMPYASFDLAAGPPLVDVTTNYFPLRRAANDTQYILGRAFLQSAYIIADYERSELFVSQALFPEGDDSDSEELVAIVPPMEVTSPQPSGAAGDDDDGLAPGAIGGIVAGAVVGVGATALVVWFLYRRRRQRRKAAAEPGPEPENAEPEPQVPLEFGETELEAPTPPGTGSKFNDTERYSEMEAAWTAMTPKTELEAEESGPGRHEMADPAWPPELSGASVAPEPVYEMPANEPAAAEIAPASTAKR